MTSQKIDKFVKEFIDNSGFFRLKTNKININTTCSDYGIFLYEDINGDIIVECSYDLNIDDVECNLDDIYDFNEKYNLNYENVDEIEENIYTDDYLMSCLKEYFEDNYNYTFDIEISLKNAISTGWYKDYLDSFGADKVAKEEIYHIVDGKEKKILDFLNKYEK